MQLWHYWLKQNYAPPLMLLSLLLLLLLIAILLWNIPAILRFLLEYENQGESASWAILAALESDQVRYNIIKLFYYISMISEASTLHTVCYIHPLTQLNISSALRGIGFKTVRSWHKNVSNTERSLVRTSYC